jgi:hypothetical protein
MTSLGRPSTVTKINDGEQSLRSTAPDLPRGFATSIVEMLWPSIPPISRMSISRSLRSRPRVLKNGRFSYASGFSPWQFRFPCYDETTSAGPHTELSSCREIGLRGFDLREYPVLRTSETSIPDSLRISDTRPK